MVIEEGLDYGQGWLDNISQLPLILFSAALHFHHLVQKVIMNR